MATNESRARSGFRAQPRLTEAELRRISDMAYRYACWSDVYQEETPAQFAETVLGLVEALLVDHAEIAGYGFRADGYYRSVAEHAAKVPQGWRPGWGWPGRVNGTRS